MAGAYVNLSVATPKTRLNQSKNLCSRPVPFFFGFKSMRGKRGRKGERIEGRDEHRDGDRDGELLIQSSGDAGNERRRDEHGCEHERDGDDRPAHFFHRLERRLFRRKPVLDVMLDRFDDDDGIIDHETDGEHQAEERERVHGEPEHREQRERADQRDRARRAAE